ncbi:hypothetical protein ERX37_01175 [Macrococcus hajekii]|uniref:Uncharacterized protein n=1 Tax=Macrococcus hajekii TaxID=198482 RepID=A0A4R6BLY2_9STAP|nr:hypothetical protein [Macrococcus hajekii]TDM02731.1 hypothetical protein ERX37_01175 [Macrococcus hajekii]GGB03413.1 hypothetical protein GCM10007190_09300 [Macrococcus hajekii]
MNNLKKKSIVVFTGIVAAIMLCLCLVMLLVELKVNFESRIGYSPVVKVNHDPGLKYNLSRWIEIGE